MKPQNSSMPFGKRQLWRWPSSCWQLAGLAGTALAAAAPNQITVHDQDLNSGVIVLDSVTAAQDGWVVIYKNPNFTSGEIVGYAPGASGRQHKRQGDHRHRESGRCCPRCGRGCTWTMT